MRAALPGLFRGGGDVVDDMPEAPGADGAVPDGAGPSGAGPEGAGREGAVPGGAGPDGAPNGDSAGKPDGLADGSRPPESPAKKRSG